MKTLRRFFEDIHRISEMLQNFDLHGISLSQTDRDLLANYRRYAPRAKKETVNG